METASLVAISTAVFVAISCALLPSLMQTEKLAHVAREKRMAAHRMNARLLRFDI